MSNVNKLNVTPKPATDIHNTKSEHVVLFVLYCNNVYSKAAEREISVRNDESEFKQNV